MSEVSKKYFIEKTKVLGKRLCQFYVWEADEGESNWEYVEEFRSFKSAKKKYPTASYHGKIVNDITMNG